MSFTKEVELREYEQKAKDIFKQETISDSDAKLGAYYINKWKELSNHIERTQNPIFNDKNILMESFVY